MKEKCFEIDNIRWLQHDGEYKRLGRSIFGAEIGLRPYTGFYIDMSWSFAILY